MKQSITILILLALIFSVGCGSEPSCEETVDSLRAMIVEYKLQDKEKNDLVLEFNQKISEYGNIQDSIKVREQKIAELKRRIQRRGKASWSESRQLNQMLSEIDKFVENNQELAQQLDSVDYKTASQTEIVKILLNNIKDKQNQINQLKTSVRKLKQKVRGLEIDNKNLTEKTATLEQEKISLDEEKQEIEEQLNKSKRLTIYSHVIDVEKNAFKKARKAKNITHIDINFSINKSAVVKGGEKYVYVRIIAPNGSLLYKSESKLFKFNGKKIGYSFMKAINYRPNKRNSVNIPWNCAKGSLKSGQYTVDLFIDSYQIDSKVIYLR